MLLKLNLFILLLDLLLKENYKNSFFFLKKKSIITAEKWEKERVFKLFVKGIVSKLKSELGQLVDLLDDQVVYYQLLFFVLFSLWLNNVVE